MSVKEIENYSRTANETRRSPNAFDKPEEFAFDDADDKHKKFTIRAGRMYRAECRSDGSRPRSAIEWYLLEKNQRHNVGQSKTVAVSSKDSSSMVQLGEKRVETSLVLEGMISGIVETQQVSG